MLGLAFALLCTAALLGAALAVAYFRGTAARPPSAALRALHAALGAAGFGVLILVLRCGLPQTEMGTAGFGASAGWLLALALGFGLRLGYLAWRRRRPGEMLIGIHAGLAICGLVLLLAVVALR